MTEATLRDDIALRIALAARALPDTTVARLIRVIEDAVGLPPTAEKLAKIKVKDLKEALDGELQDVDASAAKEAIGFLRGEFQTSSAPPPPLEPYAPGDMPNSIRVACASNNGELLDGHFGSAGRFLVYQVSSCESRLIEVRIPDDRQPGEKNENRAHLISDCQILYVASIGGPAAAKVVKADVHPIKDPNGGCARDRIHALQEVLADKPPPWLSKILGRTPEERVHFEREASEP